MSEKKMRVATATANTFAVGVIDTAKFAVIADKDTKSFANQVAKAMNTEDTAKGAQAYFINAIHKRIASGETIENAAKLGDEKPCKNLPEFCARYFGLSRSQSFNLSRAGSFLKVTTTEDTGKVIYTDVFTNDYATPNFSNTVLIRFADFIGDTKDSDMTKAQEAKGRLSLIYALVKDGKIKPDMSVNAIMEIVRGTDGGNTTGKDNSKDNSKDDEANGKDNSKDGKANGKKSEKVIRFELSEKTALALKSELIKAMDNGAKSKEYPNITALINEMNEMFKKK